MKAFEKNTDEELIISILKNDNHDALGELYNRYFRKVQQKCFSIVKDHDEAFDLAQESLIRAFDNLKNFRGDSSFSTWVYIITHRYCLGELRKRSKVIMEHDEANFVSDETNDLLHITDDSLNTDDRENIMFCLLNGLPENEKELLLLKYGKGESIDSLQSIMNLSSSAIKMRLKRSREKLHHAYVLALSIGLSGALANLQ